MTTQNTPFQFVMFYLIDVSYNVRDNVYKGPG